MLQHALFLLLENILVIHIFEEKKNGQSEEMGTYLMWMSVLILNTIGSGEMLLLLRKLSLEQNFSFDWLR